MGLGLLVQRQLEKRTVRREARRRIQPEGLHHHVWMTVGGEPAANGKRLARCQCGVYTYVPQGTRSE